MNAPAQHELVEALRNGDSMTRGELVRLTGRSPDAVSRLLFKLKSRGVVRCGGVGRYSRWEAA